MPNHEQSLEKYSSRASEEDISRIGKDLGKMKRGPIAKAWANVTALWALIKDPKAAWGSKAIAIGALLYLVSPIDAIPDVIPVFGLSDDAAVIAVAVAKLATDLKKYKSARA